MSGGLGGGFFGTEALYISPFDLIFSFIPKRYLPYAIYFMILIKIGLCGLFFCIFLQKNSKFQLKTAAIVTFSCCYALMSYNLVYSISPMWYDAVMLLPLLALFLEPVIAGKKSPWFVVLMAFCIISNYYLAYMTAIAVSLYFIFRVIEEDVKGKSFCKRFGLFVIHGLISAGMSLFVLIPVVLDFGRGKLSDSFEYSGEELINNSLVDVLKSFLSLSYPGLETGASPNVFCGSVVVILALIWLLAGKKNIRARICSLVIVFIYFLSFIFGPLDRIWHGFRDPVCFSVRYAFTFSFFMICFAVRGFNILQEYMSRKKIGLYGLLAGIAVFYTFVELYINSSYLIAKISTDTRYTLSDEYYKYCDVADNLIPYDELDEPEGYGRIISNYRFSYNDGALYGYDDLARFSSSYNHNLNLFFHSLGVGSDYHTLTDDGITPPVAALINAHYILSYSKDLSDYYDLVKEFKNYSLYENANVLPFAFLISEDHMDSEEAFSDNVYENQNLILKELLASADVVSQVFEEISYDGTEYIPTLALADTLKQSYEFTADKDGHYFLYSFFVPDKLDDYEANTEEGYDASPTIIRNCYLDGKLISRYASDNYSMCIDLGNLSCDDSYIVTLESSGTELGQTWIYYYNENLLNGAISNVNGFSLEEIGKKGITLSGLSSERSNLLVSLPYEKGYQVLVDGKPVKYRSYRDALMLIPVEAGEHVVSIKYCPPGLKIGIVFSLVTALMYAFWIFSDKVLYRKQNG